VEIDSVVKERFLSGWHDYRRFPSLKSRTAGSAKTRRTRGKARDPESPAAFAILKSSRSSTGLAHVIARGKEGAQCLLELVVAREPVGDGGVNEHGALVAAAEAALVRLRRRTEPLRRQLRNVEISIHVGRHRASPPQA